MPRPTAPRSLLPLLFAFVPACSYQTDTAMYDRACGVGSAPFALLATSPKDGDTDVRRGVAVTLTFSDYPDPAAPSLAVLSLRSGSVVRDASITVDLVTKSIRLQPRSELDPGVRYTVQLTRAMQSMCGDHLGARALVSFTTGTASGGAPPPPKPATLADDVQPILKGTCAYAGCHDKKTHAASLVLADEMLSAAMLIQQPAVEVRTLGRVVVGDPAGSYLVHKILGTPDVVGDRMPLGGDPLPPDSIRLISDWIATGAR